MGLFDDAEIDALSRQLEEKKAAKAAFDALPAINRLAEALHEKLCSGNHTDGCSWHYESWERPGYSREYYTKMAGKILAEVDFNSAIKVIKHISR